MSKINIKFSRLHENAILPKNAHDTDSGYDLSSVVNIIVPANGSAIVDTGLKVAHIEPGYWFHIMPRSSLGFKFGLQPHLGVIDSGYTGSLGVKIYNFSNTDYKISVGDRVAQIIFYPLISANIEWGTNTSQTVRGECGFGSTGK